MNEEEVNYAWEEQVRQYRLQEQLKKEDYYLEDGSIERCECGSSINSHGHCPSCDY